MSESTHHRVTDFLRPTERKKRLRRKRWVITAWIVGAVFFVFGIGFLAFNKPAFGLYHAALAGKTELESAKTALERQQFKQASTNVESAIANFQNAQKDLQGLRLLKIFPGISRQFSAVDNLLHVGTETSSAILSLTKIAEHITAPLQKDGDVNFATITVEEKRSMLKLLSESGPDIQGAKAQVDLARIYLDRIPDRGLFGPLAKAIQPLKEQLPAIQSVLDHAIPAIDAIPGMVGFPKSRKYLFLLENNSELRPTGGFIGTYGIVELRDGEIGSFFTDNIYNLDKPAEAFLNIKPPAPLQKYLNADRWFLRDANWSPDFPTSAQEVLRFYDLETRKKNSLGGVIAMTPTMIQSLLKLTGDITVNGIKFTQDNLVDVLEYQVQLGFLRQGIAESERKEIIGILATSLFDRLLTMPKNRWPEMWKALDTGIKEKQVMLYMANEEEQQYLQEVGWSGAVSKTEGDSLLVADANLASLKSDPGVQRTITYGVAPEGDQLIANLQIHYNNQGTFNWKSTRYRTYVRVYVPEGSELLSAEGYLTNDKLHGGKPGTATSEQEIGKTVFGGFISIEPKEQGTITLRYRLPERIAERYTQGAYSLIAQKQAGTLAHGFALDIKTSGRLQSHSPSEGAEVKGDTIHFSSDLRTDRVFDVSFRP